jgi:bacterioferritin
MDPFRADIDAIRRRAREGMSEGPITDAYAADPERVVAVLNEVLATELVCALRYRNNAYLAAGIHAESVAHELREHAVEEEEHAHQVAERIVQLGGNPDMNPEILAGRSHSQYYSSTDIEEILRENLVAERIAIDSYTQIVRWLGDRDPTTRRLMEAILAKEEEHAEDLVTLLGSPR